MVRDDGPAPVTVDRGHTETDCTSESVMSITRLPCLAVATLVGTLINGVHTCFGISLTIRDDRHPPLTVTMKSDYEYTVVTKSLPKGRGMVRRIAGAYQDNEKSRLRD